MKKVTLQQLSKSISSGITPFRGNPVFWEGGTIPWLKTEQLGERNIFDTSEKITERALSETSIKLNPVGTVSIAMYGEGKTRGNVSILRAVMTTNQACCNVVLDPALADCDYIFYYLKNHYHSLRSLSSGVRKNLNSADIKGFGILLPDTITQQKRISAVLSALDAKIELNNRINVELEGMAELLYDYWFVQYDFPISAAQAAAMGKPHLEGKPYRASGGKLTHNETLKREIPEGWTVKPLFDAMAVQYGFPFSTTQFTTEPTDIPVVRIRDILANTISLYTTEQVDSRYELLPNDLVIGMDGNFHMNFWDKGGRYLNQRSVRIRARANSSISTFQAYFEMSPYIKAREKNVSRTTVGHLSDKDLKRLYLLEPANGNEFAQRQVFDSMLSKITHARAENQELTALRDWLLPMLMNGQVSVG